MAQRPGLWGRLLARIEGEVPSETLEAYRRAGETVFDLLRKAEERRLDAKIRGIHPWALEPSTQAELLAIWNAFALQTIGDELLDADYRVNPVTVGYVPPVTAEQILACYRQVERWLSWANQAASNPDYRPDMALPADLPPWVEVEPCPRAHLEAMLATAEALRAHAEAAITDIQEGVPPEHETTFRQVRQLLTEANSAAEYASRLWSPETSQALHEQVERLLKDAMERYYVVGQLMSMPGLIVQLNRKDAAVDSRTQPAVNGAPPSAPAAHGFDPWVLTDPSTREQWKQDSAAREAIEALWAFDPDARRTLAIQSEIDAALTRGDIAYSTDRSGARVGHYYCCPWAPVYVVKRPVRIGGQSLRPQQEFTFDVSAEEVPEGGEFRREILVAVFQPTDRVDYCNPREGGHDDDDD